MGAKYFGAAVLRREDPRFLRGEGRFVDDVTLPGLLQAAFLRSPHAHARIVAIRTERAKKMPGVVAVFTHADLARWMKPLPLFGAPPPGLAAAVKFDIRQAPQYALATQRVRHVGEIVAMVVADDRGRAEDAVEAIEVQWAPLPPAVDMLTAGEAGAPLVHPDWGTNVAVGFSHAIGDAARALGRPVKWLEDRRASLMGAAHARHQTHTIRLGARRDGTIVGLADRIWLDLGAYNVWGVVLPYNTVAHLIGPYRIRDMKVDVRAVVTNKTPNAPYRGAGRPETVFAMDRAVDCLARRLGLDPADVRRKNYIRPEELPFDFGMPYRDGNPLVYDSGDFPAALESALTAAEYDRVRKEQASLRARGVWRGVGISGYVEGTAIGPFEGARVTLDAAGRVQVATGAVCSGQGHETSFAQVAADALGVPLDWVTVTGGDTAGVPFGVGTFASRSGVTAGNSIADAAGQVRAKVLAAAGALLEAAPEDLEIEDGRVFVRGAPSSAVDFARIVQAAIPTFAKPGVVTPDFDATAYHHVPTVTFASAVHVAIVDVDRDTGAVKLVRYVVAHDCGKVINPIIVDGQVPGGVAQGVGGALFEDMAYDAEGQLLAGSLMDYAVPAASDLPPIETIHLEFPSPRNPLGMKGLGEGGAISPPAAIANAIDDALAPLGVRVTPTPALPWRVRPLLAAASASPPAARRTGS